VSEQRVVAIDGPAASGKSSTAAAVAQAIGFVHIDSGALYRALAWIDANDGVESAATILAAAAMRHLHLQQVGLDVLVHIDGVTDVETAIRSPAVNAQVSAVAAMPALREWVDRQIREMVGAGSGSVIDGRDIGTVVVPDAGLKIYLTATPEARARRRLLQRGHAVAAEQVAAEAARLAERDRLDSSRLVAPLRQAPDAILLDTSRLDFADQVGRIVGLARERGW
jgi:cytidylate kinase